ncbi:alpha/beta-Hydrolases superfamily protein [Rhynchospora pubera]|uniref:Alpha/beta-Hydrolases superfamily protein n=1 Tax=Rhynchospora pubera TaxID=906938 RepID=A0AAV8G177_9POAL|nr:alpha/beta-Hydrolases superfamily protein [Rhynchospora pubera]
MGGLQMGDSRQTLHLGRTNSHVIEEIHGLIRVYSDGSVDRLPAVPDVPCNWALGSDVTAVDVAIDRATGVWARIYTPRVQGNYKPLPMVVYFHGGGFCVGSAAWSCYHQFLARLSSAANCVVVSVNYRLAPEYKIPAAYDDGVAVMKWLKHQSSYQNYRGSHDPNSWIHRSNFDRVFLAGDSAGATIAYHVATRVMPMDPMFVRGVILIQPFFGGENRTVSEKNLAQPPQSALTLATSDCYWRLALPVGTTRDHPWCNPLGKASPKLENLYLPPVLVCVSDLDILRDRNMEFCKALKRAGKAVQQVVYAGVGHAFQVLNNYPLSQARTNELLADVKNFISIR